MIKVIIGTFILGLSFGSGPCLYSCGPLLISYIIGTRKNISESLVTYFVFSLSRVLVYMVLGVAVFLFGRFSVETRLGGFLRYIYWLGGAFVVLLGTATVLGKDIHFKICKFFNAQAGGVKNAALLGLVIGALPCVPLLVMFSYIGFVSRTWVHSLVYSFAFGLGTVVSVLLLAAVAAGFIPGVIIRKSQAWGRAFSIISGLVMVFLGIYLISRGF